MKFSLVSDWLTDFLHHQFKQFSTRSGYAVGVSGLTLFCLSILSWKLLGAIALGLAVAWGVYESQQQPHVQWIARGRKAIDRQWQTSLGKAIISGSGASLVLLSGFGLASATGRGWIAATLMLQTAIAIGVWTLWKQSCRETRSQTIPMHAPNLDRYIHDLAHPSLMRRMIAVRRLHHVLLTKSIPVSEQHELRDYFQILLTQETDAVIRLAVQDVLELCYRKSRSPRALQGSTLEDFTTVQVRKVSTENRMPSLSAIKR